MTGNKLKHLEFIQNVITRMNTNSFQIKGWTVTIVSAMLAIYVSSKNSYFILAGIFPNIIFWFLDSFYLQQERKYRGLYNDVAEISDNPKNLKLYEMRPDLYVGGKYSLWSVFTSRAILIMYLSITIILVSLFIYLKICK